MHVDHPTQFIHVTVQAVRECFDIENQPLLVIQSFLRLSCSSINIHSASRGTMTLANAPLTSNE